FSVEGGSAGMHTARLHAASSGAVATALSRAGQRDVLVSYASGRQHTLAVVLPVPLSSVSGSANRPHVAPADARSGPRNWLGQATPFAMNGLWTEWLGDVSTEPAVTSALVLRSGRVAVGYADGAVRIVSQAALVGGHGDGADAARLDGHTGAITALHEPDAAGGLLLSASKDLTLRIWDAATGECVFVLPTQSAPAVRLVGAGGALVLGVGADNATTLVSASALERVHVTAAYHAAPERLTVGADGEAALLYADGSRRQFALGPQAAAVSVALAAPRAGGAWLGAGVLGAAAALALDVDVEQLQAAVARAAGDGATADEMRALAARPAVGAARAVLAQLCAWGVSAELDGVKRDAFGLRAPARPLALALSSRRADAHTALFPGRGGGGASWCVSSQLNAQRMLAILVLARGVLQGNERRAVEVINFYVGRLPALVGRRFKALSLLALAQHWQARNGSLQRAARTLLLAAVRGASERQRRAELFYWSSMLARGTGDGEDLQALTIVCVIGGDFPALLALTARSAAAARLQALALGAHGAALALALELLARGYAAFRPYVDSQAVVRRLAAIMAQAAEAGGGDGAVSFALVGQAKQALLRIGAADMAAVAAALGAMLGGAVDERWRALQAVGVVAAKQPAALAPHVEALAAAVVGALEPRRATTRRRLLGAGGAALRALVRAFPWVSFDAAAQCLAVGCADGRCVAFDVRTATRTAVCAAGARVVAVAVAPGAARVASFALDGVLRVWDPQPSALAMFAKSLFAPPAEAQGSVAPAKTMAIPPGFLADTDDLPVAELLRVAALSWTGERTVLLQIRDASFSLSV
ncbi:hypothetical protein IWW54_004680, partial [Coemansia sp. RSA 2705]